MNIQLQYYIQVSVDWIIPVRPKAQGTMVFGIIWDQYKTTPSRQKLLSDTFIAGFLQIST